MSSKSGNGLWEPNAPQCWTVAAGLLYRRDGWKFAVIDKTIGPQFSDAENFSFYRLPSYSDVNAAVAGYAIGNYEMTLSVDNLLDSRSTTLITESAAACRRPTRRPARTNISFRRRPV